MIDGNSLLYGESIGKPLFYVNNNIFGGTCNKQRAEVFFALLVIVRGISRKVFTVRYIP
jgi:hypothetical protein